MKKIFLSLSAIFALHTSAFAFTEVQMTEMENLVQNGWKAKIAYSHSKGYLSSTLKTKKKFKEFMTYCLKKKVGTITATLTKDEEPTKTFTYQIDK